MDPIVIATILFVGAALCILIDLFIPSGGALLIASILLAFGSILFAFRSSVNAGLTFMILVLSTIPASLFFFVKVWPHTQLGKKLLGELPEKSDYHWASVGEHQNAKALIGEYGVAATEMIPTGLVEIGGRSFEALTEGRTVEKGKLIRVLRIEMGRLVVAESEGNPLSSSGAQGSPSVTQTNPTSSSLLDQPIEQLGLESLIDTDEKKGE